MRLHCSHYNAIEIDTSDQTISLWKQLRLPKSGEPYKAPKTAESGALLEDLFKHLNNPPK